MFLKHRPSGRLVEILEPHDLWDPFVAEVMGQFHAGEELQEAELFPKSQLIFLSDEPLPTCWLNPNYRNKQPASKAMAMAE